MLAKVWRVVKSGAFWGGLSTTFGALGGPPMAGFLDTKTAGIFIALGIITSTFSKAIHERWFEEKE